MRLAKIDCDMLHGWPPSLAPFARPDRGAAYRDLAAIEASHDDFAYVGSPNFDMRSLFLNYEDALCVYSPEAIAEIRGWVDGLISECAPEPPVFPKRRVVEQIALLLAPEL